jgi:hypothetical protein
MRLTVEVTAESADLWDVTFLTSTVPSHFSLPIRNGDYFVTVQGLPAGACLKDVTCGGRSCLNEVFSASAAAGELKAIVARDGARIAVKAADQDGNPVAGATVVIAPANANSEAAMANAMITGEADAAGAWSSPMIAPGKYYVIATRMVVNHGVETIAKLWLVRAGAEVLELDTGETLQVNRVPAPLSGAAILAASRLSSRLRLNRKTSRPTDRLAGINCRPHVGQLSNKTGSQCWMKQPPCYTRLNGVGPRLPIPIPLRSR